MEMSQEQARALRIHSFIGRLKDALDPTNYQPNKSSPEDQKYDVGENSLYLKKELETMTPEEKTEVEGLLKKAEEFLK